MSIVQEAEFPINPRNNVVNDDRELFSHYTSWELLYNNVVLV